MEYRTRGRTGFRISEVGFGCGNQGGLLIRSTPEERVQAVNRAVELGINYFDTAPMYGSGQSETNLGEVLQQTGHDVFVATKVLVTLEDLSDIPSAAQCSVEASLSRIQRSSVNLVQLHNHIAQERSATSTRISLMDVLGPNGVADAFNLIHEQGLADAVGYTALGETDALHQVAESGRFDTPQVYYNLINPSAGQPVPPAFSGQDFRELIANAASLGMGVVAIRIMAAGAVGGPAARQGHASSNTGPEMAIGANYDRDMLGALEVEALLEESDLGLPQTSVEFVLRHTLVSTALVGFSNISQIEEAAACSPPSEATVFVDRLRGLWATDFNGVAN
jgi:aryl-alcohol dehydrogenase-like predicted oxidoreductase